MNNENVKKFYELLKADNALAKELKNEVHQFAAKQSLADEELEQVNAAGAGAAGVIGPRAAITSHRITF